MQMETHTDIEIDEPCQRILVHWIYVRQIRDRKEQDTAVLCHLTNLNYQCHISFTNILLITATMYLCMYIVHMYECIRICMHVCMYSCIYVCMYSFIKVISIAPLQVLYYSEALPTQHGCCAGISRQSATGNCELGTCPRSLRGD